ncbi:polysaccharide deacetylase family protein [Microbacterium sp.]|uniref:polysaccharide deacetylase family protein n=1 Tax=Microbacterium sp. TaxID=51671 RepID=UPI003340CF41
MTPTAVTGAAASGRLALTFDDRHLGSWIAARPLLDAVGARATFFLVEADLLEDEEQRAVRTLLADGHRIGSHGARHRNADEAIARSGAEDYLAQEIAPSVAALTALGASARTFAYPNSRRDDASDDALLGVFDRLRGGGPRGLDPVEAGHAVLPSGSAERVHPSRGIDTGCGPRAHPADSAVLSALLRTLAEDGGSLVLYAHDVAPASDANHIHPDRLRQVLAEAAGLGLDLVGMDDLAA